MSWLLVEYRRPFNIRCGNPQEIPPQILQYTTPPTHTQHPPPPTHTPPYTHPYTPAHTPTLTTYASPFIHTYHPPSTPYTPHTPIPLTGSNPLTLTTHTPSVPPALTPHTLHAHSHPPLFIHTPAHTPHPHTKMYCRNEGNVPVSFTLFKSLTILL